jgi:hypothetical protein
MLGCDAPGLSTSALTALNAAFNEATLDDPDACFVMTMEVLEVAAAGGHNLLNSALQTPRPSPSVPRPERLALRSLATHPAPKSSAKRKYLATRPGHAAST